MKRERKDTRVHLLAELEKLPVKTPEQAARLLQMTDEARSGEYHDYKNDKYVCGKMAVIMLLAEYGGAEAAALAERVKDGEFDEEADEEDKAELRELIKDFPKGAKDIFQP